MKQALRATVPGVVASVISLAGIALYVWLARGLDMPGHPYIYGACIAAAVYLMTVAVGTALDRWPTTTPDQEEE